VAIVLLALQPNLANPDLPLLALSFAKGAALVVASLALSKYVLPRLFKFIALVPELLLLTSLGWCFCVCAAAHWLGLSVEMGALIAGIAISTFPYNLDVIAKVISIRDFFVTLFFVSLGMMIPNPLENPALLLSALLCALFLIVSRFVSVSPILYGLKQGHRISLLPAINLANVSEFSLVIATLGVNSGHIGQDTLRLVIFVFVITSVLAPYLIEWNGKISEGMGHALTRIGLKDIAPQSAANAEEDQRDIAILGFYREASSFIRSVQESEKENRVPAKDSLFRRMMVIDFNPNIRDKLQTLGIRSVYGDLAHKHTLEHVGLSSARLVISTVPDTMLVGTDNLTLARQLKDLAPKAKIVVSAESPERARKMYAEGADYVILPRDLVANDLLSAVNSLLCDDSAKQMRQSCIEALQGREEIIK
jgi:hypothetical protein